MLSGQFMKRYYKYMLQHMLVISANICPFLKSRNIGVIYVVRLEDSGLRCVL